MVPAFDEAYRIGRSLGDISAFLADRDEAAEIVVVDDGSRDATAAVVERFGSQGGPVPVRLVRNPHNRGKGHAVRRGLLAANGELVLLTDADLSAPITQAELLLEPVRQGRVEVAIGSRGLRSSTIERRQAWPREALGRSFNRAIRAATGLRVHDTQCGFKALRRQVVRPLVEALRATGFGFDVELLLLCRAAGLGVLEVPVRWSHRDGSKVRVLRDGLGMLRDAGLALMRLRRGDYDDALTEARRARRSRAPCTNA